MKCKLVSLALFIGLSGCASIDLETERETVIEAALARSETPAITDIHHRPIGLHAAIRQALANNAALRARLADTGLARVDRVDASRPANPVLGIAWFPEDNAEDFLELELSAAVIDLFSTPWRARSAGERYDAVQRAAVLETLNFIADVERAWIAGVAANQRLELAERIAAAAEASFLVSEELSEAGNIPSIDLTRERLFVEQHRLALADARHLAGQAARHLGMLLGGVEISPSDLPQRLSHPQDDMPALADADLLQRNLLLTERRLLAQASARDAGLARFESLFDHTEIGVVSEREDGDWESGAVLETALPVFDFGRSRRARARILAIQAADAYRAVEQDISLAEATARAEYDLSRSQADRYRDNVLPAAEALMERSMRQYNAMQLGVFELLATVQTVSESGLAYVDALERAHLAAADYRLLQAGGLPQVSVAVGVGNAPGREPAGGH